MAEKPWDIKTGPKTPEEERTEKIKAAIKGGTFGKTPPGKELGTVGVTDAWTPAEKAERRQRRIQKLTQPWGKAANNEK